MTVTSVVDTGSSTPTPAESPRFWHRLFSRKLALACFAFLALIATVAIIAPIVLPDISGQLAGDLLAARQGPTGAHLLGTDSLGRDVLERLLVGTRITLIGVGEALATALLLGVPIGLAAGYVGGWTDRVVGWLADLTFSMPAIIIILVVLSVFPQNTAAAMITLGVIVAPGLMRVVRSATLPVREELYVAAARVSGLSRSYIIFRHILPRIAGPIIVQASLLAAVALLAQTGLAFLGLLTPLPAPSWGGMIGDGIQNIMLQPWLIWPPGIITALTILALALLGDVVRDASAEGWAAAPSRRKKHRATAEKPLADSGALLSIENLTVVFDMPGGPVPVLDDVTLSVGPGETVGLVGESGCGKTITAMAVLGLLPGTGRIEAGRISFGGQDLTALSDKELERVRGSQIGLISQEPMISLNPVFRVGWQLAQAVRTHHPELTRRQAKQRVIELLHLVQLPDPTQVARRYPHELSGGMAQRVAIARALAGDPKLLIADEPTTALDVTVQAEILDLLRELQLIGNMAILLVTHDWGVVTDLCDRAVVMYAGQVVEQAEISPIVHQPRHPYTEALLAANPHNSEPGEALPTIVGAVPKPGQWPTGCHFHPRCPYRRADCMESPIPLEIPAPGHETRCIHHDRLR
ncbi:dipeptide/oligopeptide/nickel ABC transporter permease/ATP-binding protein [Amycolatopsis alkalitolerans]|uniref:Dipeptide/oligopeptide/nickel ABC transporter permease/ATP-binding protein n=1 Tax=Amycolatopsis alkalitolerans TaxID=2547244 RepID=A0A5C4M4Q6_9PSEU|nr:dipeptide/oligopeptide/nickel ABC transporter permease/ATP-binding protein [Amycolatopsis alkalitolerans]TNC26395.1 dipeptide/oligopeptide/nickel ABC transporter permease/ATP-binding protein [Amycolatopsis alkalitolerans]